MKPFTAHSWLEFWFYGLYPAFMITISALGIFGTLALWPFRPKRPAPQPCETCSTHKHKNHFALPKPRTLFTHTSTTSLKPLHPTHPRPANPKTIEAEPRFESHPAFRYSFVPPSPFGATTPIRRPSYRAPEHEAESTAPMRVRSLRHFLLPSSLVRRSGVDVDRLGRLVEDERGGGLV